MRFSFGSADQRNTGGCSIQEAKLGGGLYPLKRLRIAIMIRPAIALPQSIAGLLPGVAGLIPSRERRKRLNAWIRARWRVCLV